MSKIYSGYHKDSGMAGVIGTSPKDVADQLYCSIDDVVLTEMEMTDYLLKDVPEEFKGVISSMAYERGHSAGEYEVEAYVKDLVYDLMPAIKAFEQRLTSK